MSVLFSFFELVLKYHGIRGLNAIDLIAVRVGFLNAFEGLVFTFTLFLSSGMLALQVSQNYSEMNTIRIIK